MLSTYVNLLKKLAEREENWEDESFYLFPEKQAQRRKIINETNKQVPDELLHSLFAKKVNEQPAALAVISNEGNLTFEKLYDISNKIGRRLRKLGAEPNKLVAIVMDKGWEQIPAVYGILQAGSAFLPIDPDFPNERILQLLKDGEVQIVLTQSWIKEKMDWPGNIKCLSIDDDDFTKEDPAPLEPIQKSNDLAYVLYTSGSTGVPKGVMIEHRSVVNRMLDVNERYGIKATDRAIGLTALQHDLSIYDMFGMLMAGGAIVIPERNKRLDPAHWAEVIRDKGVTFWNSVPAFIEMYVDYLEANKDKNVLPESLRMVVMSGDWIPVSLPDRLRSLVPDVEIIGSGGPTETTVWDIYYPIGQVDPNWKSIPYGKPMTNAKYYIMKDNLEECPDYVIGEICIGGVGLARGFWKDEEKTKEKFTYHPVTRERLYKSGDIGCFLPDGNIQIAGRKDFQVKIRGLRVELSEIETILNGHGEVRDSVVIATGDSQTNKRLIGYVVPNKKFEEPAKEEAREVKESVESEDQSARGGSLLSDIDKMELKLKHLELRQNDDDKKSIDLIKPIVDSKLRDKYLARQTYRTFSKSNSNISFIKFSEFLSCLNQLNIDDLPLPKYRYASAGSLYPVQVYLYVKPSRIENVEGGTYYYNPRDHKLILLSPNAEIKKSIHTINNYPIFEESAFSIYLVAQMKAIAPVYGLRAITQRMGSSIFKSLITAAQMMLFRMRQQSAEDISRDFCMLEAGYMGQLLMTSAQENQIGLCPVGGVDFEPIRKYFDLEDSHLYLHGFIGGAIDPSQTGNFSYLQEISAAAAIKNPRQAFINEVKQYLERKLPEYMVPANIVILDNLPLTPNGKVDRKALPIPEDGAGADDQAVQSGALSPSADKISQIVGSVLKIEKINPFHNLFNLGTTSIQIVMIANLLEKELNFRPKMNEFYRLPSVSGLAESYDKHLQQNQMTEEGEL